MQVTSPAEKKLLQNVRVLPERKNVILMMCVQNYLSDLRVEYLPFMPTI